MAEVGVSRGGAVASVGAVAAVSPVRVLLRMRWALLRSQFRGEWRPLVSVLVFALMGLAYVALSGVGAVVIATQLPEFAVPAGIGFVALTALGATIVAPLALGVDDTLAPHRFAQLPIQPRRLFLGLVLAQGLGVDAWVIGLAALLTAAFGTATFAAGGMALGAALALACGGTLVGFALAVIAPRAVLSHAGLRRASVRQQRLKHLGTALLFVVYLAGIQFVSVSATTLVEAAEANSDRIVAALQWLPTAWALYGPLQVAQGHYLVGAAQMVNVGVLLVVGIWWWARGVAAAQFVRGATVADAHVARLGRTVVLRGLPHNAPGAIASRCLLYQSRDSRFTVSGVLSSAYIVGMAALIWFTDNPSYIGAIFLLIVLRGMENTNAFGQDGPALWTHITAGVSPAVEMRGRMLAQVPWLLAATAVLITVTAFAFDGWFAFALGFGVLACSAAAMAMGLYIAVLAPSASLPPGTNPLKSSSDKRAAGVLPKTLAALGTALVVESPSLVGALLHLYLDAGWTLAAYFGGLLGTLALAALVARVSYGRAQRRLETELPEVFAVVRTWAA